MQPVGPQSAFGHYSREKAKAGMSPLGKKIKGKYNDLINKKKNKKSKKIAIVAKNAPIKPMRTDLSSGPVADWAVRRVQFDQLNNGKAKPKKVADFEEDSRIAGKKAFQHLLSPIDVDRFMR